MGVGRVEREHTGGPTYRRGSDVDNTRIHYVAECFGALDGIPVLEGVVVDTAVVAR